jgi:linoleoyl-CoA desaturase
MRDIKVKFNNQKNKDFVSDLRSEVNAYFTENNISQKANRKMVIKTVSMFAIAFVPYFLILFAGLPGWADLILSGVIGLGFAGIGFSVGHDALHGSYSSNPKVNRWLGYSFNLVGANDNLWKIKHNIKHHTYTNIFHKDEDLDLCNFLRFSPNAPYKRTQRFQHFTAFLAYTMLSLAWVTYLDFLKLVRYSRDGSMQQCKQNPKKELRRLIVSKSFNIFYMLVLPLLILPFAWWQILIGFVILHVVLGFTLSIVFQLAHIVEATEHPELQMSGVMDTAWAVHQMETTANFGMKSNLLTWYVGGLNFQVEHHLFPNVCSIHYPVISKIVQEKASEYNISYHSEKSFFTALRSHYRLLRKFSKRDMIPAAVAMA